MSRIAWRRSLLLHATPGVLALLCAGTAAAQPRPHDPLTPGEREEAARLARADARVRQIAGGRGSDVALVELLPTKPEGGAPADPMRMPRGPRRAEVLISVFEGTPTGVRVVVDLTRHAVADVARLEPRGAAVEGGPPAGVTVPFAPREVDIARTTVAADAGVRAFAGAQAGYTLEYLPITTPDPELCPSGRCLEVLFRRGRTYLTTTAVVEIPTRAVRIRRGAR